MSENYETYARWAIGPIMTREQYTARASKIQTDAAAGTIPTNPAEWGIDMDAVHASVRDNDFTEGQRVRNADGQVRTVSRMLITPGEPTRVVTRDGTAWIAANTELV